MAALGLAFAHEVVLGGEFAGGGLAWWFWVLVHVAVVVALVWGRWGSVLRSAVRPLRVVSVRPAAPGTVEVTLGGHNLRGIEADSGQFAMLRPLVGHLWWQSHPFSLSAEPTTAGLTFTIKDRGDASRAIAELPVGTVYRCPLPTWRDRETHVVVRSGPGGLGTWQAEQRDLHEDYRRCIGGAARSVVRVWLIANSLFLRGHGQCVYSSIDFDSPDAGRIAIL